MQKRKTRYEDTYSPEELNTERWLPIPVPDLSHYSCSTLGRFKSPRGLAPKWKNVRTGRLFVNIYNRVLRRPVARISAPLLSRTFLGPTPIGLQVAHLDENKLNERISNLGFLTQQRNIQNSYDNCGHPYKATGPQITELEWDIINALWNLYLPNGEHKYSQVAIGVALSRNNASISRILQRHGEGVIPYIKRSPGSGANLAAARIFLKGDPTITALTLGRLLKVRTRAALRYLEIIKGSPAPSSF